jgi:hypothetical protein
MPWLAGLAQMFRRCEKPGFRLGHREFRGGDRRTENSKNCSHWRDETTFRPFDEMSEPARIPAFSGGIPPLRSKGAGAEIPPDPGTSRTGLPRGHFPCIPSLSYDRHADRENHIVPHAISYRSQRLRPIPTHEKERIDWRVIARLSGVLLRPRHRFRREDQADHVQGLLRVVPTPQTATSCTPNRPSKKPQMYAAARSRRLYLAVIICLLVVCGV